MEVLLTAAYEFCGAIIGYIFVRLGFGMARHASHIPAESLPKTHPIICSAIVCLRAFAAIHMLFGADLLIGFKMPKAR